MPSDPNLLSLSKACGYLQIDEKSFKNYVKEGKEIPIQLTGKSGTTRRISRTDLDTWKKYYDFTTVGLDQEDYFEALCFALRKFYSNAPKSNFATSTQREAGKYLSDHISGYLGEIAFQTFLEVRYGVRIRLDKNVDGVIRSQDIVSVSRRKGVENQPAFKMSIKASKMKNVWLIIGKKEIEISDRRSDYYVFVRVDLHSDHIVRLLQEHPAVKDIKKVIKEPPLHIAAQVCGFAHMSELQGPVTTVGKNSIGPSYVKRSGELRKDWDFISENL